MIEHLRGRDRKLEPLSAGPARTRNGSRWFAFTVAFSRGRNSVNTSMHGETGRSVL